MEWRWIVDDLKSICCVVSGLMFEEGCCEEMEELIVNEDEWENVRSIEVRRKGLRGVKSVRLNGMELLRIENGGLLNVERIEIEWN